jgi:hypothetical protein
VYSNSASELDNLPGWGIDPTYFGLNVGVTQNVINDGYHQWNYSNLVLDPSIASPTTTWVHDSKQMSIDPNDTGFGIGTNGQAATMQNYYYNAEGTGNIGQLQYITMYGDVGNGTDPITVGGMLGSVMAPQFRANLTIDSQLQGYYFSPIANAATVMSTNAGVTAFGDFPQLPMAVPGYVSFNSAPQIGSIQNNFGYTGINLNPTITTLTGNAGATLIGLAGTYGTLGTGGFRAISAFPTITDLNENSSGIQIGGSSVSGDGNWNGVEINTQNINTTGTIWGLQVQTDVTLTSGAIDSSGRNNLSCTFDIVDGQGQMYGNVIGGQVNVPNGTAITGTDILANNMAFTVNTGDAASSFTASSPVGITPLGFVGQIIGDGSVTGGINFCLNGYSFVANTGTIDRINNFHAAAIPGGGTATVAEAVLFYGQMPFGFVGTDNWGIRVDTEGLQNYLTVLAVGDMASKKVANASVGLELDSVTKAFLNARMTTTERNALTAINGMQIYNSTTDKLQVYAAGSWVDLH